MLDVREYILCLAKLILSKQPWTAVKGWFSSLGFQSGRGGVTPPHHKRPEGYEMLNRLLDLDGFFVRNKAMENGQKIWNLNVSLS